MDAALTLPSPSRSLSRNSVPSTSHYASIKSIASLSFSNFVFTKQFSLRRPSDSRQNCTIVVLASEDRANNGGEDQNEEFLFEDVPHLTSFLPDLPVIFPCYFFSTLIFNLQNMVVGCLNDVLFDICFEILYVLDLYKSVEENPSLCHCQVSRNFYLQHNGTSEF